MARCSDSSLGWTNLIKMVIYSLTRPFPALVPIYESGLGSSTGGLCCNSALYMVAQRCIHCPAQCIYRHTHNPSIERMRFIQVHRRSRHSKFYALNGTALALKFSLLARCDSGEPSSFTPFLAAMANIISGSSVPSMWRWSSAFGALRT